MAAAKRRLTLLEALARDRDRLAPRKEKGTISVLRDLVTESKEGVLTARDRQQDIAPLDSDTILARARRLRRTPKNLRLNDRLLRSLEGCVKGMQKGHPDKKPKGSARS